jgi:hypothetical protein
MPGFDRLEAAGAGFIIADIPFPDLDAGFRLELAGGLVVAGIARHHEITLVLESLRDGGTYAAGSAAYDSNSSHVSSPFFIQVFIF